MKTSGLFARAGFVTGFAVAVHAATAAQLDRVGHSVSVFTNADFEVGNPGETAPGWFVPRVLADQGFSALRTTNQPSEGKQCLEVRWPKDSTPSPNSFANVMQRVDATPLRGKRIKVTAAIRVQPNKPNGRAQMWLRVDRPVGMGAFDNMNDRPVVRSAWADYAITAEIADDAQTLNLGLMTLDGATAWWDDIRCEVINEFKTVKEAPRPLTDPGLSNLVAFARMLGYVRHFHPSDQAASNDWLGFIVAALPQIEPAANPSELAARLEAVFKPVAPTARVFEAFKEPPLPPYLTTTNASALRVRTWEHIGYGQSSPGVQHVYRSLRLDLDARDLATLPAYAQPTNVFRANLSRDIACLVPSAVFADERGTLPHVEPIPVGPGLELRFSVEHRGARLATVMLAWNVLQQFYPYFDAIEADWLKELEAALREAAMDADEAAFYRTLNRLVVALQDGHGTLSGPGQPTEAPLPIKVELIEEKLVIVAVASNVVSLKAGDVIERVDGVPAREAYDKLAAQVSAATPQRRKQVAFRFGWGPYGSQTKLEVRGVDGTLRSVTLRRKEKLSAIQELRPPKIEELKPGLLYVDITRLSDSEFNEALPRLSTAVGLIFDMRGYPSGSPQWLTHLSSKALQSAHWNIPKRHRPDNTDLQWETSRWELQPMQPQLTTNRVFLTDGSAISYAESIMGIVEAYRLGEIVGEPTAGTNGNINQTDLPLGYRMIWTGMQVLKHDGSRHHGVGIQPTIPVSRTIKGICEGRDEQLEQALKTLRP